MRDETRACLLSEAAQLEVRADRLTAGAEAFLVEAVRLESEAAARRDTLDGIIYAAQLTGLVAAGHPRRR